MLSLHWVWGVYWWLCGVKGDLKLARCILGEGSLEGVSWCEVGTVTGEVYIGCGECTGG